MIFKGKVSRTNVSMLKQSTVNPSTPRPIPNLPIKKIARFGGRFPKP
jgi:hypothetical protein